MRGGMGRVREYVIRMTIRVMRVCVAKLRGVW